MSKHCQINKSRNLINFLSFLFLFVLAWTGIQFEHKNEGEILPLQNWKFVLPVYPPGELQKPELPTHQVSQIVFQEAERGTIQRDKTKLPKMKPIENVELEIWIT